MKKYFIRNFDKNEIRSVSIIDELPLWSAPFGLKLLDAVDYKKNINVLDIGCGTGFPFIELAQRLGSSCRVFGMDGWKAVIERSNLKIKLYNLKNACAVNASAEDMPFKNGYFGLIVSNNGINNVKDLEKTISECSRISSKGAQFLFTFNLQKTMIEFYSVLEKVLSARSCFEEIKKMKDQIYQKRKPLSEMTALVEKYGFEVKKVIEDDFDLRFTDAETMFNHSLIKNWFLEGWEKIVLPELKDEIFSAVETEMNSAAAESKYISLAVPFALVSAVRK